VHAQGAAPPFAQWLDAFRARARRPAASRRRPIRAYARAQARHESFELTAASPNSAKKLWQYLNRRVSDWRITTGKEKATDMPGLFTRIEQDFGSIVRSCWDSGASSPLGDPDVQKNHMRPIFSGACRARLGRAAPQGPIGGRSCSTGW